MSIPERDSVSSGEDPAELFRGKKAGLGYFSGLLHPTQASSLFVFTHSLPISDELKEEEEDLQTLCKAYPNTSNVFPHLFSGWERRKKNQNPSLYILSSVMWPYTLLMKILLSLQPHRETGILSQHCAKCGDVSIGTVSDLQWAFIIK